MGILIETYYLIDYENVGIDGLTGCDKLSKTDHIIIFFTKNAKKIDMSEIADHGDAELKMIEVPPGKQSADIHIGSYLGFLVGSKGKNCNIVIISQDKDFDNVIDFWKKEIGVKSSRAQQIKIPKQKNEMSKQIVADQKASDQKANIQKTAIKETVTKKITTKVSSEKKTQLNQEIMQAVRAAGFEASVSNKVAKLVTGLYGKERLLSEVHNALKNEYHNYKEVYTAIKPVLSNYDNVSAASAKMPEKNKTEINNKIMQILSKAGFEAEIINSTASIVVKNVGINNDKQQIYRAIISRFGQNKGLNIYNHIKKHI